MSPTVDRCHCRRLGTARRRARPRGSARCRPRDRTTTSTKRQARVVALAALTQRVERLHVEQPLAERQREQVAVLRRDVRPLERQQLLGHLVVALELVGDLTGTGHLRVVRQPQDLELPVGLRIGRVGADRHVGGEVLALVRHVDAGQREHRVLPGRGRDREPVGRLLAGRGHRVLRDLPLVVALVERLRVEHVVGGEHVALHLEQVLGVAHVVEHRRPGSPTSASRRPGTPSSRPSGSGPWCPTRRASPCRRTRRPWP